MKLLWLTDLHLNFVDEEVFRRFVETILKSAPDHVLIGGDLAEAPFLEKWLHRLDDQLGIPISFVLGNHDYYRGSIAAVREQCERISSEESRLNWLPAVGPIQLNDDTTLIGHGGWGDGRIGDFLASEILLNDYVLIEDLREHAFADPNVEMPKLTPELHQKLQELGTDAAATLLPHLVQALELSEHVIVLTHVPPFREACWHEGQLSDGNWAPHFTCGAMGELLLTTMQQHPGKRMTVFCGHTHSSGHYQSLDNLQVWTGQATYGDPQIQKVIDLETV